MTHYLLIVLLLFVSLPTSSLKKSYNQKNKEKQQPSRVALKNVIATISEYPFAASIIYLNEHICGGSIITDKTILTAAHCCCFDEHFLFNVEHVIVSLGNDYWRKGHKFNVDKLIIHENYKHMKIVHDVGLIILKKSLSKTPGVAAVKLSPSAVNEEKKKVDATMLGWGMAGQDGLLTEIEPDQLMRVNIYSVTFQQCKKHYKDIGPGQLCFSSDGRRGSCNGDSGGPLVVKKTNFEQIGLMSFDSDCNNTIPEVYTRISAYYKWIVKNAQQTKTGKIPDRFKVNKV